MQTGRVAASALQGNRHSWKGSGGRFRAITASFVLDQTEAPKRRLGKINHIAISYKRALRRDTLKRLHVKMDKKKFRSLYNLIYN